MTVIRYSKAFKMHAVREVEIWPTVSVQGRPVGPHSSHERDQRPI